MVCLKIIFALILYLNNKSAMEIKKRIIIFLLFILNIWSFIAAQQLSVDVLPLGGSCLQIPCKEYFRIVKVLCGLVLVKDYHVMMAIEC